jgi:hypothetical protein
MELEREGAECGGGGSESSAIADWGRTEKIFRNSQELLCFKPILNKY